MEKIIGGEYSIEAKWLNEKNSEPEEIVFSTGRCALYAILKDICPEKGSAACHLMLPDFLCDSIVRTVTDAGWTYSFYRVNQNFHPAEGSLSDAKVFLLINYFGMVNMDTVIADIRRSNKECIIIVDGVQAFYTPNYREADYVFFSYRKWFPCPDGAGVIKNRPGQLCEMALGQSRFSEYKLAGNVLKAFSEKISEEIFLPLLRTGEELLDKEYLCECSAYTKEVFRKIQFQKIAQIRKENAQYLHRELQVLNIRHFYTEEGIPFFVPIFVDDRDGIRKRFFEKNIFTPIHWPFHGSLESGKNELYEVELSLICDQRYGIEDMRRQIEVLREISEGK